MSEQLLPMRLKKIREYLGYSQRDLAAEFKVTNGAIAHWESGTRSIPGPVVRLIEIYEKFLDVDVSDSLASVEALESSRDLFKITMEALHKEGLKIEGSTSQRIGDFLDSITLEVFSKNRAYGRMKVAVFRQLLRSFVASRGLSIKVAQLASFLELGIPPEFVDLLGDLQSSGRPMSGSTVMQILKDAYGKDLYQFFSHVSLEPLAVTSLAQIHRGTLQSGEEVVLKIRHAEIERILEKQFTMLSFFLLLGRLLGRSSEELFTDIRNQVMLEIDYEREVLNQEKFRNIFEHEPRIVIPRVFRSLCRKNIIVSQYETGLPFSAFCRRANVQEKSQAGLLITYFHSYAIFVRALMHADAHPGNFLFRKNQVVFMDFGRIFEMDPDEVEKERSLYAAILSKNKCKVIQQIKERNLVADPASFDFEGFWNLLLKQQEHHLKEGSFKFTRSHLRSINLEERNFRDRKKLKLDKNLLRSSLVNVTLMSLLADLEAEAPWRRQALSLLSRKVLV